MIKPWCGFYKEDCVCEICGCTESEHWYYLGNKIRCEDCKEEWIDLRIKRHYRYIRTQNNYNERMDDKWYDRLYKEIEEEEITK